MLYVSNISSIKNNQVIRLLCCKRLQKILHPASFCSPTYRIETNYRNKHTYNYIPYVRDECKDHDYKNMSINRPMSPHLTIYAPTITATTSIFQRISGVTMSLFTVMLSLGGLFLPNGVETYAMMMHNMELSGFSAFIIKIILAAPFCFHYFNGIRFIAWSLGKWLDKKQILKSAKNAAIASAVSVLIYALIL